MKPQQKLQCAITLLAVHFIYSTHSMAVKMENKATTEDPAATIGKLCEYGDEVTKNPIVEPTTLLPVNDNEPKALPVHQTTSSTSTIPTKETKMYTTEADDIEVSTTTTVGNDSEETTVLATVDATSFISTTTTTTTTTAKTLSSSTERGAQLLGALKETEEELREKIAEVEAEPLIFSARV